WRPYSRRLASRVGHRARKGRRRRAAGRRVRALSLWRPWRGGRREQSDAADLGSGIEAAGAEICGCPHRTDRDDRRSRVVADGGITMSTGAASPASLQRQLEPLVTRELSDIAAIDTAIAHESAPGYVVMFQDAKNGKQANVEQ